MPNLSQIKRTRILNYLERLKDVSKEDDEALIAIGEVENEITSKKYGLVWEQQ